MTSEYSRSVLRMVVAQICQTVGWHSINTTPLEFMVDLMQEYLLRIAKLSHQYAEVLGRTEANLDDVGLTFQQMNIDVQELLEYVKNVDSVPCPVTVPKFPIHRENHLNFLKPGSREVVTRPVHVHEHLPAMYPNTEEDYPVEKSENVTNNSSEVGSSNGITTGNSLDSSPHRMSPQGVFKRPGDPISFESPMVKRVKLLEEGRPLREIHSVMMTTSGFLSPAREGKLPEARTPHQTRSDSPQPTSYPMVPPELKSDKKPKKIVKKVPEDRKLDKENKKKIRAKELFTPDKIDESKIKKLAGMKELAKLKPLKPGGGKTQCNSAGPSSRPSTPKLVSPKPAGSPKQPKVVQPKTKTDKVVDLTANSPPTTEKKTEETVDKLPSEPDKQKLNIFKKISKPREEKDKDLPEPLKHKEILNSCENSPSLMVDENNEKHPIRGEPEKKEEKKTPHTPDVAPQTDPEIIDLQSPSSDVYMFDDMSPPGTPSTPKTPELNVPNPADQKKKKKEKVTKKKEPKLRSPKQCVSPKKTKISNDTTELDILDRPKTPQAPEPPPQIQRDLPFNVTPPPPLPFPFFPPFHPGPGLIPHPMGHPMFPRLSLPLPRGGPSPHPAMPNLPIPPRFLPPSMKPEDFPLPKPKILERDKPFLPPPMDLIISPVMKSDKLEKEKPVKVIKHDKELTIQPVGSNMVPPPLAVPVSLAPTPVPLPPPVCTPVMPPVPPPVPIPVIPPSLPPPKPPKVDKMDKIDKKTKEHKKEKKDKLKKKKDKKEKHKEKGEKLKEKKEKPEKKEKVEKVKEKKEKKEKKKEKEPKDDKNAEGVPKLTLKLGPSSPRPPTPDNTPMKKITIKTLLKKPLEEAKREPSPELAKISALVTRPPKQKLASKKTEEGALDGGGLILSTDTSFSTNLNSVSLVTAPRTKKSLFKALPSQTEPSQTIPNCDQPPKYPDPSMVQQPPAYYFDQEGHQVWICPACGNQDDGTPMIGCDDCDAWYHWVCVGMQVPPAANEDWYCRFCISKKQELHHDKKKKKRKKKVKMTA